VKGEKVNKQAAVEENFVHSSALHINHRPIDAPSAEVKIDATRNKNRKRKTQGWGEGRKLSSSKRSGKAAFRLIEFVDRLDWFPPRLRRVEICCQTKNSLE